MPSTKTTRYDFMIPFFGLQHDERVRLFLDTLSNNYLKTGELNISFNEEEVFLEENYESGKGRFMEWLIFLIFLKERLNNKTEKTFNNEVVVSKSMLSTRGYFDWIFDTTMGNVAGGVVGLAGLAGLAGIGVATGLITEGKLTELKTTANAAFNSVKTKASNALGLKTDNISSLPTTTGEKSEINQAQSQDQTGGASLFRSNDSFPIKNNINVADFIKCIEDAAKNNELIYIKIIQELLESIGSELYPGNIVNEPTQWTKINSFKFKSFDSNNFLSKIISNLQTKIKSIPQNEQLAGLKNFLQNEDPSKFRLHFSYRLTLYVVKKMVNYAGTINNSLINDIEFWESVEDSQKQNIYFRPMSNPEKIYKIVNGTYVDVTLTDEKAKELIKQDKNCGGFKFKESGTMTCKDYFEKCISSDVSKENIQQCKQYLQSSDFWDIIKDEINNMLPAHSYEILNKFGFEIILNGNYKVFESVASWLNKLQSKSGISLEDYEKIKKNNKLITYLDVLVDKFNLNPTLLNKNIRSDIRVGTVKSTYLNSIGIQPLNKTSGLKEDLLKTQLTANTYFNYLKSYLNNSLNLSNGAVIVNGNEIRSIPDLFKMRGGGIITPFGAISNFTNKYEIKQQGELLENLIKSIEDRLNSSGKVFDSNSKKILYDHLELFKKTEVKLIKAIRYAEKYLDLILNFKDSDKTDILNLSHMKKFIDMRNGFEEKTNVTKEQLFEAINKVIDTISDNNTNNDQYKF